MRPSFVRSRAAGLVLALLMALPSTAFARKQGELRYGFEQVWNAALRMIRVDLRLPVTDRDAEAGYLLFDYLDHEKRYAGSIELVRGERDHRPLVKVVVQVQGMPAYVEQMILDRLLRKLRDEYGEPLEPERPSKPKEPEPKPDDGSKAPEQGSDAPPSN